MKKIASIILLLLLVCVPLFSWGNSNPQTQVYLNGQYIYFDVPPQNLEGRTLVPLRTIFEFLGLEVDWNNETQKITGTKEGLVIEAWLGKTEAYVNGNLVLLDVAPVVMSARTLVPIRFIAEATGATVNWLSDTQEIIIKTKEDWPSSIYIKTVEDYPRCNSYGVIAEVINIGEETIKSLLIRVNYLNNSDEVVEFEDIKLEKEIASGKREGFYSGINIGDYLITNIKFEIISIK